MTSNFCKITQSLICSHYQNLIGDYSIGIAIMGSGRNITVQHCLIANIGWIGSNLSAVPAGANNANAILVDVTSAVPLTRIQLRYDTITNCATGYSEALTIAANVDTFAVTYNFIYANSNIGVDIAGNTNFAVNPPASVNYARNGVIAHNIIFRCNSPVAASAAIYLDGAFGCTVDANAVFDNAAGISLGQERAPGSGGKPCSRNSITNNVIYRNAVAGVIWGDNFNGNTKVVNNSFCNNTLVKNRTGAVINGILKIGGRLRWSGSE